MEEKLSNYGGQAIIEGVMMRGKINYAYAVREPGGKIVIKTEKLKGIYQNGFFKLPFFRGLIMLWDSLGIGIKALTESANIQTGEDEKIEGFQLYLTLGITFLVAIGIFFLTPAVVGWLSEKFLHWNAWWGNFVEGVVRLVMLIGYIGLIGLIPDIRRVFAYHGAEHKAINAFEANAELKPEIVQKYSTAHPRCGTAFLLSLMVISLFVFTLMGPLPLGWRIISRILMIPVLVGISYEYLKWTANNSENWIVKILIKPNLALQSLTTREPDISMIEVAISAFHAMRQGEAKN